MKKLLLPLLLVSSQFLFGQSKLVGFSESGEINAPNSGGMIWEMNPDGSGFQVLKNFHIQKPVHPLGEMVIGPDGQGYGFAGGYDIDAGVEVFYQYNFTTKDLSILKVFNDSPFAAKLLMGTDGVLYGFRRLSDTRRAVCKISLEGEVLADIYEFEYGGTATGMTQTPDGRIVLTCEKYGEGPFILGGYADGTDWKTMVSFEKDILGNYMSNLVAKSDGYLYGITWQGWGILRFFKILQNGQDFSYFYETTVPNFGDHLSLNLGADEVLYALAQKGSGQVIYQVSTEANSSPVAIFEDTAHGYLWSNLARDEAGNFYYHTARINNGSQMAYLLKFKNGLSLTSIVSLFLNSNQDRLTPILFNPINSRLYFWKTNDNIQFPKMMSCKTDGDNLLTEYNLTTGIPSVGASPKKLIQGSDGKYYGLMGKGGQNGNGLIFSMNPDGSAYKVMAQMLPAQLPITSWPDDLVTCFFEASDGWLYGTIGDGRIFKIDKNGDGFTVLYTELHHRSNFIEYTDGMLYWGSRSLMRMAKDGTNKTEVLADFNTLYSGYDFCELFQLPNGRIAGAGSYTVDANCLDYYTYPFCFSYDPNNNTLQKAYSYYSRIANTTAGQDGLLYFGKGKYNPENNSISPLNLGCDFFPDLPNDYTLTTPAFEGSNGLLFGQRTTNDGRWLPMAWFKENGACEMSIDWDASLGNKGTFAFETSTASTPTYQPIFLTEINLSPNPTNTSAQLSIHLELPTQLNLLVLDLMGRRVFESNQRAASGTQIFEIPASAISTKGIYKVVLKTETGTWSKLLSVQ